MERWKRRENRKIMPSRKREWVKEEERRKRKKKRRGRSKVEKKKNEHGEDVSRGGRGAKKMRTKIKQK